MQQTHSNILSIPHVLDVPRDAAGSPPPPDLRGEVIDGGHDRVGNRVAVSRFTRHLLFRYRHIFHFAVDLDNRDLGEAVVDLIG